MHGPTAPGAATESAQCKPESISGPPCPRAVPHHPGPPFPSLKPSPIYVPSLQSACPGHPWTWDGAAWAFAPGFSHGASCFQSRSTLWQVSDLRFLVWPGGTPLPGQTVLCPSLHPLMDIWVVPHFNCDQHCHEHPRTRLCVHLVLVSPGRIAGSGIAGSRGSSMFNFWGTTQLLSKPPFYMPPMTHGGSNRSESPLALVIVHLFDPSHPGGWEVSSRCDVDVHRSVPFGRTRPFWLYPSLLVVLISPVPHERSVPRSPPAVAAPRHPLRSTPVLVRSQQRALIRLRWCVCPGGGVEVRAQAAWCDGAGRVRGQAQPPVEL